MRGCFAWQSIPFHLNLLRISNDLNQDYQKGTHEQCVPFILPFLTCVITLRFLT